MRVYQHATPFGLRFSARRLLAVGGGWPSAFSSCPRSLAMRVEPDLRKKCLLVTRMGIARAGEADKLAKRFTLFANYRLLLTLILTLTPQRPYLSRSAFAM